MCRRGIVHGSLTAAALLAATVSVTPEWPADVTRSPQVVTCAVPVGGTRPPVCGSTELTLEPGQWFVNGSAPDFWSAETLLHVLDDASSAEARFVFERAATVTAKAAFPAGRSPRELVVHFQPATGGPARSTRCPIEDRRVTCVVPLGTLDLAFRAEGHATVYRWDTPVVPAGVDLGAMTFQRGSTISGRVQNPGRDTHVVVASPRDALDAESRLTLQERQAPVDARGRFAIHLAPGRYRVHAHSGNLRSEEREVSVADGREAALLRALILEPPRKLTVTVHPPRDPWQRSWEVRAGQSRAATDEEGNASFELSAGSHPLEVRSGTSTWLTTEVSLDDDDRKLDLVIEEVLLRGTVTIGDEPLPSAWITFIDEKTRVRARGAATGSYGVRLPKNPGDAWKRIEIRTAQVFAVLEDARATRAEDGAFRLDIALPATRLTGAVKTQAGSPADALITIHGADGFFAQLETVGGAFETRGLPSGRYRISATGKAGSTAQDFGLLLEQEADVALQLVQTPHIRGIVVSPFGPVSGATIYAARTGEIPRLVAPLKTDAAGAFDIRLSPGTEDVTVLAHAPGYALRLLRLRPGGKDVQIALMPHGGVLRIDPDPRGFLMHDSAAIPVDLLVYLAEGRMDGEHFEIPIAEEGVYALCPSVVPDGRCRRAFLARHGSASLED
jgi:hypothetical protein